MKTIVIGGDHAGYEFKNSIIALLEKKEYPIIDKGPFSAESVDYPDFVHPVCQSVLDGHAQLGILICGSGNGVAITANKYPNIRCGLCWEPEIASLTVQHNNANVIAIPARFIDIETAHQIVNSFLKSEFEGGRHLRRVDKITSGLCL